jgi:hypothetical protein
VASPPVLQPREAETLNAGAFEAHLSAARTLRRAARRQREDSHFTKEASRSAGELIAALHHGRPWEARIHSEAILASTESGEFTKATALMTDGRRRFPGALQLAYAEARVGRAVATLGNGDRPHASEVVEPLRRFRRFDMSLRPVELLETIRTELSDTRAVIDDPLLPMVQLKRIIDEPSSGSFADWWRVQVGARVFGTNGATVLDVDGVRANLRRHGRELDALEEDFANRVVLPGS